MYLNSLVHLLSQLSVVLSRRHNVDFVALSGLFSGQVHKDGLEPICSFPMAGIIPSHPANLGYDDEGPSKRGKILAALVIRQLDRMLAIMTVTICV